MYRQCRKFQLGLHNKPAHLIIPDYGIILILSRISFMSEQYKIDEQQKLIAAMAKAIRQLLIVIVILLILLILSPLIFINRNELKSVFQLKEKSTMSQRVEIEPIKQIFWSAASLDNIKDSITRKQVAYGKELIAHTAKYLGPKGSVQSITNGMNCQNCHLDAGTRTFGNNYGSVASTYPKFRGRSGTIEDIYKRINDCIERSLNGKALDTSSVEMQAIKAYIEYVGSNVVKGQKAPGSGLKELDYLNRAADPVKGKEVYVSKCQTCHLENGQGQMGPDGIEYLYPPLWGKNSYNVGAGLYRISNFAKYIKYNMPLGVVHTSPQLSDEEAWDVSAFINSQERPGMNLKKDWPDISKKPVDHPFGPYADAFTENQHKYGPFKPILEQMEKSKSKSQ